ncbi:outer membrane protein assembly factor BamB [Bradyrhizobium sp. LM6.10]|jgi:outer membrane protein assembly factor BamB
MRKIYTSIDLPNHVGRLVLFEGGEDSKPDENLVCFEPDGRVRWKAKLPTSDAGDCFVAVVLEGDLIRANSWSCHAVWLNPETGEVVRTHFTK